MSPAQKKNWLSGIPAQVVVLGTVSFLTDVSADMIYPLLPLFLTRELGASQAFIGLIEGIAESTAAFFTLVSGMMADRARDRSRIVLAGYTLSSLARPLTAAAQNAWTVLLIRFSDRMGKGLRTSARDALIAESVVPSKRGEAFGLQRSMDHLGSMTGPIVATVLLATCVHSLRHLFALAAIPAALSVLLIIWKVREVAPGRQPKPVSFQLAFPKGRLRVYFSIYFLFVLSCSSDAFLLLRARELGVQETLLPLLWMTLSLSKALSTYPMGALSDRIGRRRMILAGWLVYAAVYAGFAFARDAYHAWTLFAFYGFFYGLTEGSERAILADYSHPHERGRIFGWYYLLLGFGSLPASLIFGRLWQVFGSRIAFLSGAGIALTAAFLLLLFLWRVPALPPLPSPAGTENEG